MGEGRWSKIAYRVKSKRLIKGSCKEDFEVDTSIALPNP
jgi:hypothetical protein